MSSIYGLIDPRTGCLRYVGKTIRRPSIRLSDHISESRGKGRSHRANWIRALLKLGLRPVIEVLEEVDAADDAERFWIASLRAAGAQLVNRSDGGDEALAEVRKLIPKGWKHSDESRARISAGNLGPKSQETRSKMAEAAKRRFREGRNQNLRNASRISP